MSYRQRRYSPYIFSRQFCPRYSCCAISILNDQISQDDKYYKIILAFAVVAVVEEGTKFLLMKLKTWKNPNFNYSFDGIVYAVSVSLGFAAFENIKYVMNF